MIGRLKRVVDQLMDGTYANGDHEMYKNLYNSLLNTQCTDRADTYFILKDFRSYADAQKRVEEAYRDQQRWSKMAMMNTACSGKFTLTETIEEYVRDIWHLEKVEVPSGQAFSNKQLHRRMNQISSKIGQPSIQ